VCCACDIIPLFSVVFSVVRPVHEFDLELVINEKKLCHAVSETHVFGSVCMFSPGSHCEC
jgi:hypothetical protein